jgi:thiol-disulfide isomerase/thioredoxin
MLLNRLFVVCLSVLLCGLATVAGANPTLNRIDLGSHAAGPAITVNDLRGRVVVVEYWGITCPPCLAAIPKTTELAEQYGHEKLIIVANQVWGASDRQCKEVWEARAKSNFVAVFNGGSVQGFNPRGVPSAVVFDHEGNYLWQGHPGGLERVLAEAVAKVPDRAAGGDAEQGPAPIITDLEPKYFEREIEQINEQDRTIARTLRDLQRDAERADGDRQAEAKAILEQVDAWVAQQQSEMDSAKDSDPATSYGIAEKMTGLLRGDDRANAFIETMQAFERDAAAMDRIRAALMLREIKAQAEAIGLHEDAAAAKDDRSNSRALRSIERDLRRIVSVWPNTPGGEEAQTLLQTYGFD